MAIGLDSSNRVEEGIGGAGLHRQSNDDHLREHVEGGPRHPGLFDVSCKSGPCDNHAFERIAGMGRVQGRATRFTDAMAGATGSLYGRRDARRGLHHHDLVKGADVDPEFE